MRRLPSLPLVLLFAALGCTGPPEEDRWDAPLDSERPRREPASPPAWHVWAAERTTSDRPATSLVTRIYDVSDLTWTVRSYAAPEIGDLRRPDQRPDFGQPRILERSARFDEAMLLDLIQENIARDTWDDEGVSITIRNGRLIVRHRGS